MEPATLLAITASAALGAVMGFVGGKRNVSPSDDEVTQVPPPPDPRVDSLLEENALLRRISGVEGMKSLPRDPKHLGTIKETLGSCLADVLSARGTRSAAFFDDEGLIVAGDSSEEGTSFLGLLLASIRPRGAWQRIDWSASLGESVVFERLQLGRKSLIIGVLTKGELPDSALARVRFAFEGLRVVPKAVNYRDVDPSDASLQSVQRMLAAQPFGGVIVIDGSGEVREKVGLPPTAGTDQTWRDLIRFEEHLHHDGETLLFSWTNGSGYRFALSPFVSGGRRAALLTVTRAEDRFPQERVQRWARQIALELTQDQRGAA